MPRKTFKCKKCDKTFTRPGPFAWHMQSMHGAKKAKTAKKAKRRGKKRTKRTGRPKGSTSRFGLKTMTLEQLTQLTSTLAVAHQLCIAFLKKTLNIQHWHFAIRTLI